MVARLVDDDPPQPWFSSKNHDERQRTPNANRASATLRSLQAQCRSVSKTSRGGIGLCFNDPARASSLSSTKSQSTSRSTTALLSPAATLSLCTLPEPEYAASRHRIVPKWSGRVGRGLRFRLRYSAGLTAVHGNCESSTDLGHSAVAQTTDSIGKHTYRDALDGIEIDGGSATHRIIARVKDNFASEAAEGGRAGGDHDTTEARDCRVT